MRRGSRRSREKPSGFDRAIGAAEALHAELTGSDTRQQQHRGRPTTTMCERALAAPTRDADGMVEAGFQRSRIRDVGNHGGADKRFKRANFPSPANPVCPGVYPPAAVPERRGQSLGRVAGTAEPDDGERGLRVEATHREDSGLCAPEMVAAAKQRARNNISAETNLVAARKTERSRRVGAAGVEVCPVRHPLLHVAHHVEHAPARLAARPRARVHSVAARDVAVRRPVVRARVGRPAAASCHSKLVSSRFPTSRHACAARNQVMQARRP
jgi:hypothetical protein